jgi:hypothetical protein
VALREIGEDDLLREQVAVEGREQPRRFERLRRHRDPVRPAREIEVEKDLALGREQEVLVPSSGGERLHVVGQQAMQEVERVPAAHRHAPTVGGVEQRAARARCVVFGRNVAEKERTFMAGGFGPLGQTRAASQVEFQQR